MMNAENPYAGLTPGSGPDGSSLLGFLASVGALVSFTTIYPSKRVTLHWEQSQGWRGRLLIDGARPGDEEVKKLHEYLTSDQNRARFELHNGQGNERYKTITKLDLNDARSFFTKAIEATDKGDRDDLCSNYAGWFSDLLEDKYESSSKLCALTGGSQQNFLETALHLSGFHENEKIRVARITDRCHIKATLIERWEYKEPMPGCRWDAQEDRHYALRHRDPSQEHKSEGTNDHDGKVRTQRGANRLGIEALSVFPLIPNAKRSETPGFSYSRETGHAFTWPIWDCPLSLAAVRILVAHPELARNSPNLAALSPLGVSSLFRVRRIKKGKPPAQQVSFTISQSL